MENEDEVISGTAKQMKPNFEEYRDSNSVLFAIATVLDPCLKLLFVEFCYKKVYILTIAQKRLEAVK